MENKISGNEMQGMKCKPYTPMRRKKPEKKKKKRERKGKRDRKKEERKK